ncbi:ribosomal protein S18-alanine N-acetyltransferase [Streptomyces sp. NPDC005438]|uniref:ribosomal protein S18-alanine N-acetyltransferase n=1 Tax=Streptomyces sp. NPDC005438 TaxID=3156880 RepID=UPI0033B6C7A1
MSEPEAVDLRPLRWWDLPAVLELEHRLFPEDAWSEAMFWSELAHAHGPSATRRYLVLQGPRGLVGYGGLGVIDDTGDILTIGIDPDHEGTGLGSRLLAGLLAAAQEFACAQVLLEVRVDNERAQRLYHRFGFAPLGVRRGYYQNGKVDALVMRRPAPVAG